MREGRIEFAAPPPFLRLFFVFSEQERKAEAALLSLGDDHVSGVRPLSGLARCR
jgi:hypothetical protein